MKFVIRFFILICLLSASACYSPFKKKKQVAEPVDYTVVSRSPLFNKKNTTLTIDTISNLLIVKLDLNLTKDFPFPINNKDKDTLNQTAFNFDFIAMVKSFNLILEKIKTV